MYNIIIIVSYFYMFTLLTLFPFYIHVLYSVIKHMYEMCNNTTNNNNNNYKVYFIRSKYTCATCENNSDIFNLPC